MNDLKPSDLIHCCMCPYKEFIIGHDKHYSECKNKLTDNSIFKRFIGGVIKDSEVYDTFPLTRECPLIEELYNIKEVEKQCLRSNTDATVENMTV